MDEEIEDAIGIFNQKKCAKLHEKVFKNRYQRFTIFINVREMHNIPPPIHKNLNTLWIFYSMIKTAFVLILNQAFPNITEKKDVILTTTRVSPQTNPALHIQQKRN
jgi:hypothetical protein